MSLRTTLLTSALIIFLVPTLALAATSQKLGKEYVSDVEESGMSIRLKLPAGWGVSKSSKLFGAGLITFTNQSSDKAYSSFIIGRQEDPNGKVFKNAETTLASLGRGQKETFNGRTGLSIEESSDNSYSKAVIIPVDGALYYIEARTKTSAEIKAFDKSIQTLFLPERKYQQKIAFKPLSGKMLAKRTEEARNAGKNASIKQMLNSSRAQAEIFYAHGNLTYAGVCSPTTDHAIGSLIAKAMETYKNTSTPLQFKNSLAGTWNKAQCHDSTNDYAAYAPLMGSTKKKPAGWCVDSTGYSGEVTKPLPAGALSCQSR